MLEVEKISFQHLQWIYYRQAIDGYDEQGNYVQIQHAYFRGEIEFNGQKPDGYLFKDGKHFFYEYQGNIFTFFNSFIYFKDATGMGVRVYHQTNVPTTTCNGKDIFERRLQCFDNMVKSSS